MLFRTATRQICRRMGYLATFMCRPALKSCYSSGWHLHQSLVDATSSSNLFMPEREGECLSPLGRALRRRAAGSTPAPARRSRRRPSTAIDATGPNSLAPDRVTWCYDHRGVMMRVLGAPGDPASRLENRIGEPAANPYLYIASQIVAGLDGIAARLDPGAQDDEPYAADRPMLPNSVDGGARRARAGCAVPPTASAGCSSTISSSSSATRPAGSAQWLEEAGVPPGDEPTEWEQREYFDFF